VVVTGSSGFIGSATVDRLSRDFRILGFDREGSKNAPLRAECICVDLTSDESVRAAFDRVRYAYGRRIDSVVHLAAYYDFSGEPSPLYEQITVRGTERLLRELRRFDVGQFVFSSTMLVHAPCEPGQRIDEGWPLEPKWDYPQSKVKTEELIRAERGETPSVILRIAGVYDDLCHSVPLANQIQRIYERRLIGHVFPGDTSRGQAFVHRDDLVAALWKTVRSRRRLPDELTLLIGEPETLSYEELQRELGRLIHGEEWHIREIPKAMAKAGAWLQDRMPAGEEPFIKPWMIDLADDHYALDIGRARKTLGWRPRRSLRETLARMVAALKADPVGFYKANKLDPPAWLGKVAAPAGKGRKTRPRPRQ
jgi:nucleoside-diphosphate-sugar epimerase